jgi:hypothetical protein
MGGLSVSEARDTLSDIVSRVAYTGARGLLRRHGKRVAAFACAAEPETNGSPIEGRAEDPRPSGAKPLQGDSSVLRRQPARSARAAGRVR